MCSFPRHHAQQRGRDTTSLPTKSDSIAHPFLLQCICQRIVAGPIYARLVLDPTLRPIFRGDLKEHGRKLMSMINLAVANLNRLDTAIASAQ